MPHARRSGETATRLRVADRAALVAVLGALAATRPAMAQPGAARLSPERIAEILASPDRSAADRTNDIRRKPAQMLAFIGIVPGMVAVDLSSGGGYTTSSSPARSGRPDASTARARRATAPPPPPAAPEGAAFPAAPAPAAAAAPAAPRR